MDLVNRTRKTNPGLPASLPLQQALAFFMAEEGSWERLVGTVEDRALSEKVSERNVVESTKCVLSIHAPKNQSRLDSERMKIVWMIF
jgi:hypothetical protein